ncbi:GNAT family N-acetyltransferase [Bacillus solimangrovi]|uniref:Alanine acetyltransferase n=1 Tax=Bacillus solimangrovi TaxID=1305675 RepID=A0A1E5LJB4_9BACI|nr:GNAT family protein [Bacillus solimangrovi]OEH94165.1 alanine acetyltransferase [Bacillus solimangrovi]
MLRGENIYLRPFKLADAAERLQLQERNRAFFEQFSFERSTDFYTLNKQEELIINNEKYAEQDVSYQFGIFKHSDQLIGTIDLFQIQRGSLQSAFIGYFLDKAQNGKGYTTEAAQLVVNYAFEELHLHRIEAGVMPHNIGSIRVLEKVGFHKEGIAKQSVKINGKWEDHQMLAIINPND